MFIASVLKAYCSRAVDPQLPSVVHWKPGTALICRHLYGYGMNTYFKNGCFLARLITIDSVVLLFIITDVTIKSYTDLLFLLLLM